MVWGEGAMDNGAMGDDVMRHKVFCWLEGGRNAWRERIK